MNDKPLVYVAGPYSLGDVKRNVLNAIAAGEKIIEKGGLPLIPHLSHYWHLNYPKPLGWWYSYDMQLLRRCDCLVRLMGQSAGADQEVLLAIDLGMPVYTSTELWDEDFHFPPKAAISRNAKLATRSAHILYQSDQR